MRSNPLSLVASVCLTVLFLVPGCGTSDGGLTASAVGVTEGNPSALSSPGPCQEPGGLPRADGGSIQCTLHGSMTKTGDKALVEASFGLVTEVKADAVLRLPLGRDAITGFLGDHVLKISPQDFHIDVVFRDGKVLPATLTVAPSIALEGADACSLVATEAAIHLTRFESGLPDWIDGTLVRYVNESPELKAKLLSGAQAAFARAQREFCF